MNKLKFTSGKCATLKLEDIRSQLIEMIVDCQKDNVDDFVRGVITERDYFRNHWNIPSWDAQRVVNEWSEMLSDFFWDDNPDVDEILVYTGENDMNGFPIKIHGGSRWSVGKIGKIGEV